jgi:hypothetical protein
MRLPPRRPVRVVTVVLALHTAACAGPDPEKQVTVDPLTIATTSADAVVSPAARAAAAALADSLGRDLQGTLQRLLATDGPEAAIGFCADSAQARTVRFASAGRSVRRVTLRPRNPANAPDSAERAMLEAFAALDAAGQLPVDTAQVMIDAAGVRAVAYLRPIRIAAPCLTCHGDPAKIAPAIRARLAARYPTDQATGYREGELRGAWSVRLVDR